MDFPDVKALKKLANACRKAGIKSFKGCGIEFTLSEDLPPSNYKKRQGSKASKSSSTQDFNIQTDALTDEELLFWSSNPEMTEDAKAE